MRRKPRYKELGNRLTTVRKELRFKTQADIASEINIPPSTWGRYESGITPPPIYILEILVSRYCVNINWLLTGEGISRTNTG